jgi:lysophospholipase L1-like esterase
MKLKLCSALLLCCTPIAFAQTAPATPAAKPSVIAKVDDKAKVSNTIRIVLVSDSTVNHASGWGSGFCDDLVGHVECFNMSKNGRSSKSYIEEGWWQRALDLKPIYVLIHFAANDASKAAPAPGEPDRRTDPATTYRDYLRQYIKDARAAGVKPILVTPMPLRNYDKTTGKFIHGFADYAEAVRAVGAETNTPVIDLNARCDAYFDTLTQEQAEELDHYYPTMPKIVDHTHMNGKGSELIGGFVAEGLKTAVPELAKYVAIVGHPGDPVPAAAAVAAPPAASAAK